MNECRIPVYRGGLPAGYALVDSEDYARLSQCRWSLTRAGHAYGSLDGRQQAMHRAVVGLLPGEGKVVHHINEDRLDNRRANLQVFANQSEHGRAPHPKKDAIITAKCLAYAALPGWPLSHEWPKVLDWERYLPAHMRPPTATAIRATVERGTPDLPRPARTRRQAA